MLTQFGQLPIKRQVMKLMPLSLACYALLLFLPCPCPCFCSCPYCSLLPSFALLHACRLQTEEQAKHSEFNWQLMLLWSSGHLPCSLSPSLSCSSILAAGSTKRKPPASCLPAFFFLPFTSYLKLSQQFCQHFTLCVTLAKGILVSFLCLILM